MTIVVVVVLDGGAVDVVVGPVVDVVEVGIVLVVVEDVEVDVDVDVVVVVGGMVVDVELVDVVVEDVVVDEVELVVVVGTVVVVLDEVVVEEVEEVEVVDDVDVVDEVVLEVDVEDVDVVVDGMLTLGPLALHLDSARMMSRTGRPATGGRTRRWTARTMMLVLPGVSLTICSLRMAVSTPGMVTTVFAVGDSRSGFPPNWASTRLVDPVEPSPFDVHVVETAVAVSAFVRTATSATLAELVAKPAWSSPARFPPCVEALRRPVLRMPGRVMGSELPVTGP